jgi:signal transduction histidine kinase
MSEGQFERLDRATVVRHNKSTPMPSPEFQKRASDRSLLVVEDDEDIRETLVSLLSMEGFRVTGRSNGHEALVWLRESPKPDLILLDLRMPIMDGWQFRVAQKGDPQLARIPAIALSADSTAKAAAIDAEAYLKKPVDYDTLLDTIDRLLVASEHRDLEVRLAQTDRLTSMGTLAAGVAHQINNPLAYVLLNLGFVTEEMQSLLRIGEVAAGENANIDGRAREVLLALDHARDGAERIRDIVWSLKTFFRPERETCVALDVTRVLDAALAMVQNEIRHRARLVKNYALDVPEVFANEARLGQMFLNLVLNAVQALPEDRALANEIRVSARPLPPDCIVVEIEDNGVGIPSQLHGRIFEPFFSTKPVGVGTGLGLSICHGVVAALRGTLTFESEVGKGTVFRVELPTAVRASAATQPTSPPDARISRDAHLPLTRRSRILVVDDEPIVCFSLERLLAREADVVTATSAGRALAMIQEGQRFDVLLCDLMLPEMDGPALYESIRDVDPLQAKRVVFMTGGVFTVRARDFLETVENKRLSKPFDVDALLAVVRGALSGAAS